MPYLEEHLAGIIGHGHFMFTLKSFAPRIGLVIARTVTRVAYQIRESYFSRLNFFQKPQLI
jgi:hypothetical protein